MNSADRSFLTSLRRQIDRHFNLDEIGLLCFDLNIDYEHLAGDVKPKKIHNLILMVVRFGNLPDLLVLLAEERPKVEWPVLPPDFGSPPDEDSEPAGSPEGNQFQVGDVGAGATVIGNVGAGATVVGEGATVVGTGGSLNVKNYQISGDIAGDVNIGGDVHIVVDELPVPAPPKQLEPPLIADFVGRTEEMAHFRETLRTKNLAVICGMAGMGKTALASALARQVAAASDIFWHTFHQGDGVEVIIWQIAGFLANRDRDDLWQLLQRARLTRGQLPPTETLLDYTVEQLRGSSILICLDDIHLVDEDPQMSLFVERTRTAVQAGDLSLVVTSRRLPDYVTLVDSAFIAGLSLDAVRNMLAQRDLALAPNLVVKLHERTQGNAELLTLSIEMLRHAQHPDRLLDNLSEADNVERFLLSEIDAKLSDIEPEVMGAISLLNLFGHAGTRYAIAAILDGQSVRRVLRDLTDRFLLIVSQQEQGNEYGQHGLVQAFYYDTLSRRQRQAMHRLAGGYYRQEEPNPMRAAVHYERAGDGQEVIHLLADNLWELINLGHSPGLLTLLARLQTRPMDTDTWLQVTMFQGQIFAFAGQSEAAQECYQSVLSRLAAQPDTAAIRLQRARAFRGMGELLQQEDPQAALTWLQRGLSESDMAEPLEQAGCQIAMGTIHMWLGDYDEAEAALRAGLACVTDGPSQLRATALTNLGVVAVERDSDYEAGIALTLDALQTSRQMHDYFKTAEIMTTLGVYLFNAGDWQGGMTQFHEALTLAEQIGNDKAIAYAEITMGVFAIDFDQENLENAQRHLERGLRLAQKTNQQVDVCIALLSLVDVKLGQAQWQAAAGLLAQAEEITLQLGDQLNAVIIERSWGLIRLGQGEQTEALAHASKAVVLAQAADAALELGINWRVLGQVHQVLGQTEEAREAFRQSWLVLEAGYPFEAARTQLAWGATLVQAGDLESGRKRLHPARAEFLRLGAQHDLAVTDKWLACANAD